MGLAPGPTLGPLNNTLLYRLMDQQEQQRREQVAAQQAANQSLTQSLDSGGKQYVQNVEFNQGQQQQAQESQDQLDNQRMQMLQQAANQKAQQKEKADELQRQLANDAATQQYHNSDLGLKGQQLSATIDEKNAQLKIAGFNADSQRMQAQAAVDKSKQEKVPKANPEVVKEVNAAADTLMSIKALEAQLTPEKLKEWANAGVGQRAQKADWLAANVPLAGESLASQLISPEQRSEYDTVASQLAGLTNSIIKNTSGGNVTANEMIRNAQQLPLIGQSPEKIITSLATLKASVERHLAVRQDVLAGRPITALVPEEMNRQMNTSAEKLYGLKPPAPAGTNIAGQPQSQSNTSPQIDPQTKAKVAAYFQKTLDIVKDKKMAAQLTDQWAESQGLGK